MRLRYIILYVEDVRATLDFYQRAFDLTLGFVHEAGDYGELRTGDTKLAVSSKALMTDLGKSPGNASPKSPVFELAFETDDVAAAFARAIDAGAIEQQEPKEESWGQITAYVSDADGYLIEICSPV